MTSTTSSKRAKKLVNRLFELQYYDFEITAPCCIAIKHCLKFSKHCKSIEVSAGFDTAFTIRAACTSVQKFILSQLQVQKLTNQDFSSFVTLSQLACFVLSCIPARISKGDTVPTLFHWQSRNTHRTSFIFAFVDVTAAMSSRTYTIKELLHMRGQGIVTAMPDAPQKGRDQVNYSASRPISSEARTLGRGYKHRPQLSQHVPSTRVKNDMSVTSDDNVFLRHQPRRGTMSSLPTDMEWKYRGRTESEAADSAEPLSAPTGLNIQHSEGFQRFYKAVISPTHIRVTAGGRIVPNTRGASPMSKRLKDKTDNGNKNGASQPAHQQAKATDGPFSVDSKPPAIPVFALPPHHFYSQFPASMSHIPMMPFPMGLSLPSGFQYTQQAVAPVNATLTSQTNAAKSSQENVSGGDGSNEVSEPKTAADEKASEKAAAENFEQIKPFVINGQIAYPLPTSVFPQPVTSSSQSQYMPPGFIGHSGFPVAPFPNAMISPAMSHIFPAPVGYHAFQAPQQLAPSMVSLTGQSQRVPLASRPPSSGNMYPPPAPPISSIRPSDISKKQIDLLRNSLKYHEDQLQYNKHQVDEKEMERTIAMLQSQIDKFEGLNKSQLQFEEIHYPRKDIKTDEASRRTSQSSDKRSITSTGSRQFSGCTGRSGTGKQQARAVSNRRSQVCFSFEPVEPPVKFTDPVKKSTLPTGAALAPPFEPRTAAFNGRERAINARSFGSNDPQFNYPQKEGSASGDHKSNPRTNDSQNKGFSSSFSTEKQTQMGRPYLVGTLPAGMDVKRAQSSDFVYERELCEDEKRARYLYWGKAPQFTREGLPKFDGKDFYPPSPKRGVPDDDGVCSASVRKIPIGNSEVDYGFEAPPKSTASQHLPNPGFIARPRKAVKVTLKRPKDYEMVKSAQQEGQCSKATDASNCDLDNKHTDEGHAKATALPNMLRRSISSNSDVLPGSFSLATAQGILPQYSSGYESLLAASLSPVISSPKTPGQQSPIKSDEGGVLFTPTRKIGENRPPPDDVGPTSLEQKFRSIVTLESKQSSALPVHWD